jgi:hypothetical protein
LIEKNQQNMAQPRVEKENTVYALIYQQNMKTIGNFES